MEQKNDELRTAGKKNRGGFMIGKGIWIDCDSRDKLRDMAKKENLSQTQFLEKKLSKAHLIKKSKEKSYLYVSFDLWQKLQKLKTSHKISMKNLIEELIKE